MTSKNRNGKIPTKMTLEEMRSWLDKAEEEMVLYALNLPESLAVCGASYSQIKKIMTEKGLSEDISLLELKRSASVKRLLVEGKTKMKEMMGVFKEANAYSDCLTSKLYHQRKKEQVIEDQTIRIIAVGIEEKEGALDHGA